MRWNKYTIHTTEEAEEPVLAMLAGLGITAVEIEDKKPVSPEESGFLFGDVVPEIPEDDHLAGISFYVEAAEPGEETAGEDEEELLRQVRSGLEALRAYVDVGEGDITGSGTEDREWIDAWKEHFHSFFVDDIEVIPSWEDGDPDPSASMVLRIDPGTAFGTGKHETTQLAIRQLRKYCTEGYSLLDVGTGSGILGIVALKSGAGYVYGTDIDPVAFPALTENLEKNGIERGLFEASLSDLITEEEARKAALSAAFRYESESHPEKSPSGLQKGYDVITANIIAEILSELTPHIPGLLKEGGIYIMSGILKEKLPLAEAAVKKAKMKILEVTDMGEWCAVTARKPTEHYRYFEHRACEYFPCHEGADPDNFNCLFCYCPLHFLGKECPGNPQFNEKGVKNCTNCSFPHRRENYDKVIETLRKHKYFG